jgi:hypothetical protein
VRFSCQFILEPRPTPHLDPRTGRSSAPDGGFTSTLPLSTKYYTARVRIVVAPSTAAADPLSWSGGSQLLPGADAVLLSVDGGAPFDEGARAVCDGWAACASAAGASTLLLVSVVVGTDTAGLGVAEGHVSAALEWALDNGFEHVCADPRHPGAGGEGRDKSGIPRVLEALEATVWSNAAKAVRVSGGGSGETKAAEEATAGGGGGGGGGGGCDGGAAHLYEPPPFSGGGSGSGRVDLGGASSGAMGGASASAVGGAAAAAAAELPAEPLEKEHDFEQILSFARATRDAARSGNLSDEQRREAAMSAAMRLMELLGVDDDGEGEGEGGPEA